METSIRYGGALRILNNNPPPHPPTAGEMSIIKIHAKQKLQIHDSNTLLQNMDEAQCTHGLHAAAGLGLAEECATLVTAMTFDFRNWPCYMQLGRSPTNSSGEVNIMKFDKIIISGGFPFTNGKVYRSPTYVSAESENQSMDLSDLEKELFSKVPTIDYYTTVMKIKGLDHLPIGFYYCVEFMDDPTTIGNPVAIQRFYANTDIYLFWSYGNVVDIKGPRVTELEIDVVNRMGGLVENVILQRWFKYFPHITSQDMKEGFYGKMETELQGQQNTYYVGRLVAFELTERNSMYAMNLVRKHFSNDDPLPKFPYVKEPRTAG